MRTAYKVEGIEDNNPSKLGGMASRSLSLRAAQKDISAGIDTVATTEAPAMVIDWSMWCVVREILPMRYMEAPENDKVPLLDSHDREEIANVKGSARDFTVNGSDLMCKTFISSVEPQIIQNIKEGHIDSVSIGYQTDSEYTVQIPKGARVTIDGVQYTNDYTDDIPLVVRTWWKVQELSLVAIGADSAAKFRGKKEDSKAIEKIAELQARINELEQSNKKETGSRLSYYEAAAMLNGKI